MITKVVRWKSADGQLWESENEANYHELKSAKIKEVVDCLAKSSIWLGRGDWEDLAKLILAKYDLIAKTGD